MSVTSGFFNSLNGDRRYNSEQMSAIFDGLINDGVYASIGTTFAVTALTGFNITVGIGRCWFNSTWLLNDAILPLTLEPAEVLLDRIDVIVIEMDHTQTVRTGSIKIVKGIPATAAQPPAMIHTEYIHQHPLAHITRKAGSTQVTQANVVNMVGTSSCPFVTGIVQVTNIDIMVAQWQAQWAEWMSGEQTDYSEWSTDRKHEFDNWFATLYAVLDDNTATRLADEVYKIKQVLPITLYATNWTSIGNGMYTQIVHIPTATPTSEASLVKSLSPTATPAEQLAYNKAFSIVSAGSATLGDKIATFKVYKQLATDVLIGLKGLVETDGSTAMERELKNLDVVDIVNWSSQELIEHMGAGWNLSNSLDSWHAGVTKIPSYWETLWGNPVTTMAIIREVKRRGFNTVRVPVTWRSNLDTDGDINDVWMNRVAEVVQYVLDANMFCIINVHHDTGPDGVMTAENDKIWTMLFNIERLWKQIGLKFAKHDYRLIFEGFNEMVNPTLTDIWYGDADSYKSVNLLNQRFVDTVRAIPGNENRFLLCSPYGAQYQLGPISAFEIPHDSVHDKILARLNVYHSNPAGVYKTVYNIEKYFKLQNIPCIITEIGITNYETTSEADRLVIIKAQSTTYRKMGIPTCLWNSNLDRNTLDWAYPLEIDAVIDAYQWLKREFIILDRTYNVMDKDNYRAGEYGYTTGLFGDTNTRVCFATYVMPGYDKFTVTTTVSEILFMITQMDKDYKYLTVAIQGNYGGFDIDKDAKYLGITLFSNSTNYTLAEFRTLMDTNTFQIVPREDAKEINWYAELQNSVVPTETPPMTQDSFYEMFDTFGNPESKRKIFRGKNLGSTVTSEQLSTIRDGSFKGLFIGDYWLIGGVTYRIADFNYWLNVKLASSMSEFIECTKPHLVVIPDQSLMESAMKSTESMTGAYSTTIVHLTTIPQVQTNLEVIFGEALLEHPELITNTMSGHFPVAGLGILRKVDLLTEPMIYGCFMMASSSVTGTTSYNSSYIASRTQLALFQLSPKFINAGTNCWLKDVSSSFSFAAITSEGVPAIAPPTLSYGIRPVFTLG